MSAQPHDDRLLTFKPSLTEDIADVERRLDDLDARELLGHEVEDERQRLQARLEKMQLVARIARRLGR